MMNELNIEQYVKQQIELMQQQGQEPVAVMLGHEDWLDFSVQSKVAYHLAVRAVINLLWVDYCWSGLMK